MTKLYQVIYPNGNEVTLTETECLRINGVVEEDLEALDDGVIVSYLTDNNTYISLFEEGEV